jgi:hypothetical protein
MLFRKNRGEYDKQIHYASIIQKLQRELPIFSLTLNQI